jgi:hypothetical protein
MNSFGVTVGRVRLGSVGAVRWVAGALLAASAPFLACSSSSSASPGGCATLQACCNAITNTTIAASCTSTLTSDQSLPDSDQTCAGNMLDFQSYCSGAGGDGGTGGHGDATKPDSSGGGHEAGPPPPTLGFTPSNVDLQGIDTSTLVDVDVPTTDCILDSNGGGISCASSATVTQSIKQNANGVTILVYYVKSFKLEPNAVLSVTGFNPVAIVSLGDIDIEGQLLVNGQSSNPGAGGCEGVLQVDGCGGTSNTGGGQAGSIGNGTYQGGSGGGYCGAGGAGGAFGGASALPGGIAWGTASLIPFAGGASGGGANDDTGGGGGGALQLVARTSITIGSGGFINAGGGGGGALEADWFPGAGGGSGGAILLEAPSVTVAGALGANGGGGGAGDDTTGNQGADATPTSTPAAGGSASGTVAGGSGGAGSTAAGGAGEGSATPMGSENNGSAGGGGGGAGRIRINTSSGKASVTGTVSPSLTTSCATQGTLNK